MGCQHHLDFNGDGKISTEEFVTFGESLQPVVDKADALTVFRLLDVDHDGSISLAECAVTVSDFKARLSKFHGSTSKGCEQMDVNGDNMIDLGEFKAGASKLLPRISPGEQVDVFNGLDRNKDSLISEEECYIHTEEFMTRMHNTGDAVDLFTQMDLDRNHSLSRQEFMHGGHMLKDPIPEDEMGGLLRMMDMNHNGAIEFDEFIGNATEVAIKLTGKDLEKYRTFKAVIVGTTRILFTTPKGEDAPSDEEVAFMAVQAFQTALDTFCGSDANVENSYVVHKGAAEKLNTVVHLAWESVMADPVRLAMASRNKPHSLTTSMRRFIKEQSLAWTDGSDTVSQTELTYEFFGDDLNVLPNGPSLAQSFGEIPPPDDLYGNAVIQL